MLWMTSMMLMSKNPYFLIIALLLMTFYSMYLINILLSTTWFSLLILIILIGGLLVLFLYLISLIPKEKMNMNIMFPIFAIIMSSNISMYYHSNMLMIFNPQIMYQFPSIMMFSILFLLTALFTSTQLTNLKSGPLRLL